MTNIVYGKPGPFNFNDCTDSLGQLCIKRLTKHEDKIIIIDAITGETSSGAQIRDSAIRVADLLWKKFNVSHEDRVGVCAENQIEFASVIFGTFLAGSILAPINVTYTERKLNINCKINDNIYYKILIKCIYVLR